jgi:hypothetical protein
MDDTTFATELVLRLNSLCEDNAAKSAVLDLLDSKVYVGTTLDHHKSCHVSIGGVMGPLGMMNGLVGSATIGARYIPKARAKDNFCGFILAADCEDAVHVPVQSPPEWAKEQF